MAIDRYSGDYRLKESVDERGRIRTETEYIGSWYRFSSGVSAARKAGRKACVLCALCWMAFFAALYPESGAGHALYAALPCAFLALPLWLLSAVSVEALRVKEPFVRRDQERFTVRFPAAALFVGILALLALLGGGLRLLLTGEAPLRGDVIFLAGNAVCFCCALLCRRLRPALSCEEAS